MGDAYVEGKVSADGPGLASERVCLAEHLARLVHDVTPLEDDRHGGSRSHVPEREAAQSHA